MAMRAPQAQGAKAADPLQEVDTHRVMAMVPLLPYHYVADVGCGDGYFTVPLAKYVFDGRVYAVDWRPGPLEKVRQELERQRLSNAETLLAGEGEIPLEDESLDGIFMGFLLGRLDDPRPFLREAARTLRKGGWLAVLEWTREDLRQGPPPVDKTLEPADARKLAAEAGLRFTSHHPLASRYYILLMRK